MTKTITPSSSGVHEQISSDQAPSLALVYSAGEVRQELYLSLCAEAQVHYRNHYVPESFINRVKILSLAESGIITIEAAQNRLSVGSRRTQSQNMLREEKPEGQIKMERHKVPGDGNCGLHSFAFGMVHQRVGITKLREFTSQLPESYDRTLVLKGLSKLRTQTDSQCLLEDQSFMFALARILRQVGHTQILRRNQNVKIPSLKVMLENLIPKRDKQWVTDEGLMILAEILDVKLKLDEPIGQEIEQGASNADFIIQNTANHFTPIVPLIS